MPNIIYQSLNSTLNSDNNCNTRSLPVAGGNAWTERHPESQQSCVNKIVEQAGIGAIGMGIFGGGWGAAAGALVGGLSAIANSAECASVRWYIIVMELH